jgi:hypothetical protein
MLHGSRAPCYSTPMRLADWCKKEGYGSITRVSQDARVAYTTVLRAVNGKPTRRETAMVISRATRGEVDIESLMAGSQKKKARKGKAS